MTPWSILPAIAGNRQQRLKTCPMYGLTTNWNSICCAVRCSTSSTGRRLRQQEPRLTVAKGIRAIRLLAQGYTNREIGEEFQAPANHVTAWVAKARKHLAAMAT